MSLVPLFKTGSVGFTISGSNGNSSGSQGGQGANGAPGANGATGANGVTGATGATGAQGVTGSFTGLLTQSIIPHPDYVEKLSIGSTTAWIGSIYSRSIYVYNQSLHIGSVHITEDAGTLQLPMTTTFGGVSVGGIKIDGTVSNPNELPYTGNLLGNPNAMTKLTANEIKSGSGYIVDSNLWICTVDNPTSFNNWTDVGVVRGPDGP